MNKPKFKSKITKNYLSFSGTGSKDKMKENAILQPVEQTAFVQFLTDKYRNFTCFDNWTSALEYLPYSNKMRFLNEIIMSHRPCKPYLDVEAYLDFDPDLIYKTNFLTELKNDIISIFKTDYGKTITTSNIFVSDSSNHTINPEHKYKLSFHLTITTRQPQILFKTNKKQSENSAYHLAHALNNLKDKYEQFVDTNVYSTDREMRTVYSYKSLSDLRQLIPFDSNIEIDPLDYLITSFDLEQPYEFIHIPFVFNNELATKIRSTEKVPKKKPTDINIIAGDEILDFKYSAKQKIINDRIVLMVQENIHQTAYLKKIVDEIDKPIYYYFDYKDHTDICTISKKPQTHESIGFYGYVNEFGQLEIRCRSAKCKKSFKTLDYIDQDLKTYVSCAITVNLEYLTDTTDKILPDIFTYVNNTDDEQKIKQILYAWYHNKHMKTLAFRSDMDTGKTSMMNKIFTHYKFISILWVTYRQTLTNAIFGAFEKFGFSNYLESNNINQANRVICQIDSLPRLMQNNLLPKYDLVIYDESESLLNHINSSTLKDKRSIIFDIMQEITYLSTKIIALDADYDNRSHHYFKSFGNVQVVINNCRKNPKHFKWMQNDAYFKQLINADITSGKNIVIVSMNSAFVENMYSDLIARNISAVIHTSNTDDASKNKLKDVNSFWSKYQCVLYSPTCEAGVSFDVKHFYRIYAVMSSKSTSPRGFLQMIGRIRKIECNETITLLDQKQLLVHKYAPLYTYTDAKNYLTYIFKNGDFKHRIIRLNDGNSMFINCIDGLFEQIVTYNQIEESNKTREYFIPTFYRLCKDKNFTLEPYDEEKIKLFIESTKPDPKLMIDTIKNNLVLALDISSKDIDALLKKKNNNLATQIEKYQIEKYIIKKTWGIEEVTLTFLNTYYKKEYMLNNLSALLDASLIDKMDSIVSAELKTKCKVIKEIVSMLEFNCNAIADQASITSKQLNDNMKIVLKDSSFFNDYNKHRLMFGLEKAKDIPVEKWTSVMFLKTIGAVLERFGLTIYNKQKNKKVKGKVVKINTYIFGDIDNILQFVLNKQKVIYNKPKKIIVKNDVNLFIGQ